jgi:RNA methyltransferase, TrmH family
MNYLFCSPDTADVYNPKVIQSSNGFILQGFKLVYTPFDELSEVPAKSEMSGLRNIFRRQITFTAENFPDNAGWLFWGTKAGVFEKQLAEKISHKV